MLKRITSIIIILLLSVVYLHAQERTWEDIDTTGYYKSAVFQKEGFTLNFINKDPKFNPVTRQRMIDLFFTVYPKLVKGYNSQATRKVVFVISSEYDGVAATLNNVVKFNPSWLSTNPEDIDCATHELMHVVQAYRVGQPGWLVEGIADYARNKFGINNSVAKWQLPAYQEKQLYTDAYRVTAAFLTWTESHYNKQLVYMINKSLRERKYDEKIWVKLTGKSIDELWYLYSQSPVS